MNNENNDHEVVEGFLCPICLRDLTSFHNLQSHFETAHSREDKAVFGQMKNLFSKAKDRILGNEDVPIHSNLNKPGLPNLEYHDPMLWDPQELGQTTSHMDGFKRHRNARIDGMVIATNKILIRLEKLVKILLENDGTNRKSHEQMVVHWAPDEDVPFCPTCGSKFNVAKRRHHCRLCGAIMCTKCSTFISYEFADTIANSLKTADKSLRNHTTQKLAAMQSNPNDNDELNLRSCVECTNVLYTKKERLEMTNQKSLLEMLYKKMINAISGAKDSIPSFTRMANSLNSGENEYRLENVNQSRFELMQMFEAVDVLSNKIDQLNINDDEQPPSGIELRLHKNIRRMALSFLQQHMLTLPSIPSEPKLKILQAKRKAETEKRLRLKREEEEKKRAEEKRLLEIKHFKEKEISTQNAVNKSSGSSIQKMAHPKSLGVVSNGWSADTVSIFSNSSKQSNESVSSNEDDEEDFNPLLDQINYVREAAKQARGSGMIEEAISLENNLSELQKEYRKQQTAKAFLNIPNSEKHVNTFAPNVHANQDTGEDPLLQQVRYIQQCINDAEQQQKWDEAVMLKQNLDELRNLIKQGKIS